VITIAAANELVGTIHDRMPLILAPTLQEQLQISGLKCLGRDITHQAVDLRAKECEFHPVRDYPAALRWDEDVA
jgi:putative SOS response-associated peptidase YedK